MNTASSKIMPGRPAGSVAARMAFTLVELLVVIGIIALLIGILIPTLSRAREQAKTVKCLSNMRQFGIALNIYTIDNHGKMCPCDLQDATGTKGGVTDYWSTILVSAKYLAYPPTKGGPPSQDTVFHCPSGTDDKKTADPATRQDVNAACGQTQTSSILQPGLTIYNWYGVNGCSTGYKYAPVHRVPSDNTSTTSDTEVITTPDNISRIRKSAEVVLIYDGVNLNMLNVDANRLNARHKQRTVTNLLFCDGHAESFLTAMLPGGLGNANPATTTFGLANLSKYSFPKWRIDQ